MKFEGLSGWIIAVCFGMALGHYVLPTNPRIASITADQAQANYEHGVQVGLTEAGKRIHAAAKLGVNVQWVTVEEAVYTRLGIAPPEELSMALSTTRQVMLQKQEQGP